jgi:predicted phosphatase
VVATDKKIKMKEKEKVYLETKEEIDGDSREESGEVEKSLKRWRDVRKELETKNILKKVIL